LPECLLKFIIDYIYTVVDLLISVALETVFHNVLHTVLKLKSVIGCILVINLLDTLGIVVHQPCLVCILINLRFSVEDPVIASAQGLRPIFIGNQGLPAVDMRRLLSSFRSPLYIYSLVSEDFGLPYKLRFAFTLNYLRLYF
jgi:hypothetical protein